MCVSGTHSDFIRSMLLAMQQKQPKGAHIPYRGLGAKRPRKIMKRPGAVKQSGAGGASQTCLVETRLNRGLAPFLHFLGEQNTRLVIRTWLPHADLLME